MSLRKRIINLWKWSNIAPIEPKEVEFQQFDEAFHINPERKMAQIIKMKKPSEEFLNKKENE